MKQFKELQVNPRTSPPRESFSFTRGSPVPSPSLDEPPRSLFTSSAPLPRYPPLTSTPIPRPSQSKYIETTQRNKRLKDIVLKSKQDIHRAALTGTELSNLPEDIPCYEPVGRSFIREPVATIMSKLQDTVKKAGEEIEKAEGQSVHLQKVLNETETNIRELLAANPGLQEELMKNGYVQ